MLKEVEITTTFFLKGQTCKGFLIKDMNDFIEYFKLAEEEVIESYRYAVAHNMPVRSWDHLKGTLGFATCVAAVKESSPLAEANAILTSKQLNMMNMLKDGKIIYVNTSGGYHEFKNETHTILNEKEYAFNKEENIHFGDNPSLLNLENDPELEKPVTEYFKNANLNISYVTNLRKFTKEDLAKIFRDFYNAGGHGLYIYTTGSDIPQMQEYLEIAAASPLYNLFIVFSAEKTAEHVRLLNDVKGSFKTISYS